MENDQMKHFQEKYLYIAASFISGMINVVMVVCLDCKGYIVI